MKASDLFGSMDEVRQYCKQFKTSVTKEEYKMLEKIFGIAEQEGLYIEIDGVGKIDKHIAYFIKIINEVGLKTLACCSGLKEDHPTTEVAGGYISFLDNDKTKSIIKPIAEKLSLKYEEGECYLQPSITVYFKAPTDETQKQIFKKFFNKIVKKINALK